MSWSELCVHRSRSAAGDLVVRFGVALLDAYLQFLAVRARPNTVAAVAYDLKVFFTVVGKPPRRVVAADVLAFVTAQYAGGPAAQPARAVRLGGCSRPPGMVGCRRARCGDGCRVCRGCSR